LTSLTDTPLFNAMHNSSRRDKGQLKAEKLKTVFIQHRVNKITLTQIVATLNELECCTCYRPFSFISSLHTLASKLKIQIGEILR